MRQLFCVLVALFCLSGCSTRNYLNELPDAVQVVRDFQVTDSQESAQRQAEAFNVLMDAVRAVGNHLDGSRFSAPEYAKFHAYYNTRDEVLRQAGFRTGTQDWRPPNGFRQEVMHKYLSRRSLDAWTENTNAWVKGGTRISHGNPSSGPRFGSGTGIMAGRNAGMITLVVGIVFLIPVLVLRFWIERRVFLRMSSGGVQQFETYGAMWKARLIEGAAQLAMVVLALIGVGLGVLGVFLMLG
jgi:hypothetical protein